MEPCCYADEYGDLFSRRHAESRARRFRRRGLTGSARELADALVARGIEGASVLEVGGGIGGLHADLVRRGAGAAVNVELSPAYEATAAELLAELGIASQVRRRLGDFVAGEDDLGEHEAVVLHRVVCCYPHWERMLERVADRATRLVGLTFPRDAWWTRAFLRLGNAFERLARRQFRAFVHPPDAMLALLAGRGFRPVHDRAGVVWRTVVLEHVATTPGGGGDDA